MTPQNSTWRLTRSAPESDAHPAWTKLNRKVAGIAAASIASTPKVFLLSPAERKIRQIDSPTTPNGVPAVSGTSFGTGRTIAVAGTATGLYALLDDGSIMSYPHAPATTGSETISTVGQDILRHHGHEREGAALCHRLRHKPYLVLRPCRCRRKVDQRLR